MRNMLNGQDKQWSIPSNEFIRLDLPVARQASYTEHFTIAARSLEFVNSSDIDQDRRLCQPQIHHRH